MNIDFRKRGVAMAIAVSIIVPLALGLMFFPPAHMELKGLPFGLLSLDEGAAQGPLDVNLGEEMVTKIENGDLASAMSDDSESETTDASPLADALSFHVYDSKEQLDQALEDNELYGALVIPEDFSKLQIASMMKAQMAKAQSDSASQGAAAMALAASGDAQVALGSAQAVSDSAAPIASQNGQQADEDASKPTLIVILDYAKSPLVATQLQGNVKNAFSALGVEVDVDVINQGPAAGTESGNIFSGMFSQMMVIMPLLICSLLAGIFAILGFNFHGSRNVGERVRRFAFCIVLEVVVSFLVALMGFWMISVIAGLPVEFLPYIGFTWLCSFFLMVFFAGCTSIRGRVAAAMGIIIILLGMTTGYLPFEALPAFWQDWVCPWAPQYYLGNGLRDVVFAGQSIWNQGTVSCLIYGVIGLVLGCLGIAIGGRSSKKEDGKHQA